MAEKKCIKCKRPLPEGYKHLYCESCRTKAADNAKKAGKVALGIGALAVTIITAGKINPSNKA